MKAFKKWLNSKFPDVEDYCPQCPEIAEESWKAALEWLKEKGSCDGMGFYCSYVDDINEELTGIKADRPSDL